MAINKIQFQQGISLTDFFEQYGTEDKCKEALEKSRWPTGFICAHCEGTQYSRFEAEGREYWQCSCCRHQTSLRSGTLFQGSKLPLRKWFQALYLMSQSKNNISGLELKRQLGVNYRSAWRVKHKIMQVMTEAESTRVLRGNIVIDDAYLGGERRGKAGRGSENKVPFVAAIQVDEEGHPQCVRFDPVDGFKKAEISQWAKRFLAASSHVVSDGLNCFPAITDVGATHSPEIVGTDRRSTDMACFNWINILLGNLKTALSGTYHAFDFKKYAKRYLAEYQYRFNRRFNMARMLPRLLRTAAISGPRTEAWLRAAEV